jgi:hypothetical protein
VIDAQVRAPTQKVDDLFGTGLMTLAGLFKTLKGRPTSIPINHYTDVSWHILRAQFALDLLLIEPIEEFLHS